ncbi:MAG: hypothetical protein WBB32_01090 [Flavobacteriales bacterium]|nr:hypothetical protein [Flavobacteriales bacterium]
MRGITAFLLLHFIAVTLAPGWIVADFWVEQDRIAQELCVQRMVPDAERTCHGECSLMKRLDKCADREQNLPNEIRAVRIGDMIADESELAIVLPTNGIRFPWGSFSEEPLDGHKRPHAPVPWC